MFLSSTLNYNSSKVKKGHHKKQPSIKTPNKQTLEEENRDGMKICRGPFNVNCTTTKDPQVILFEMVRSLEQ